MITNKLAFTLAAVLILGTGAVQAQSNSPFPPAAAESSHIPKLQVAPITAEAKKYAVQETTVQETTMRVRSGAAVDRPHVISPGGAFPGASQHD